MTPEQQQKLTEIWKQIKRLVPDIHGSIRFNYHPKRNLANINTVDIITVDESFIEQNDVTYAKNSNYCQARGN